MHLMIGLPEFTAFALYLVIFGFLWRSLAARLVNAENPTAQTFGRAMAYIF